jgi:hypothetical protein
MEIADRARQSAAEIAGGVASDDANGTSGCITAKECALRTTQNFNALDINDIKNRPTCGTDIYAVKIERDLLIRSRSDALAVHAANGEGCNASATSGRAYGHVRRDA